MNELVNQIDSLLGSGGAKDESPFGDLGSKLGF
jgi:hypothetical protein